MLLDVNEMVFSTSVRRASQEHSRGPTIVRLFVNFIMNLSTLIRHLVLDRFAPTITLFSARHPN